MIRVFNIFFSLFIKRQVLNKKILDIFFQILFIFFFSFKISGQEKNYNKYIPNNFKMQYAGNIGFISAGLGYFFFSEKINSDFFCGYIPKFISTNSITSIAIKNSFFFNNIKLNEKWIFSNSTGFASSLTFTNNNFIFLPDYMPKGYYLSNSFRLIPFISTNINYINNEKIFLKSFGFYIELSTVDNYLWYIIKTNKIDFFDIWSLAIGINIPINGNN